MTLHLQASRTQLIYLPVLIRQARSSHVVWLSGCLVVLFPRKSSIVTVAIYVRFRGEHDAPLADGHAVDAASGGIKGMCVCASVRGRDNGMFLRVYCAYQYVAFAFVMGFGRHSVHCVDCNCLAASSNVRLSLGTGRPPFAVRTRL